MCTRTYLNGQQPLAQKHGVRRRVDGGRGDQRRVREAFERGAIALRLVEGGGGDRALVMIGVDEVMDEAG